MPGQRRGGVQPAIAKGVRRCARLDRRGAKEPFEYVNWLDDAYRRGESAPAPATWAEFVARIGPDRLRRLPARVQEKNTCCITAAATAWEVQQDARWERPLSETGEYEQAKKKGAGLWPQVGRIWGNAACAARPRAPFERPNLECSAGMRKLQALLAQGPLYVGVEELGYPWAPRARAGATGPPEAFAPPRHDPYTNPWPARLGMPRSRADDHAVVIVGQFYCTEPYGLVADAHADPPRRPDDVLGNVFVVKCTDVPLGWDKCTFSVGGEEYRAEEVSYALVPADLLTRKGKLRDAGFPRLRMLDELHVVPMR